MVGRLRLRRQGRAMLIKPISLVKPFACWARHLLYGGAAVAQSFKTTTNCVGNNARHMRKGLYTFCVVTFALFVTKESYALQPSFRFQNSFWVNLHATLRGEARRRSLNLVPQIDIGGLTDAERKVWSSALDSYETYGRKNVVF